MSDLVFLMEVTAYTTWIELQHELKSFVFRKVRDKATAEDIIQDVFLKVQSGLHQLKDMEKISSWIYQITRNAVADHFRKNTKSVSVADLQWENDHQEFNECVADCLKILLKDLPDMYRIPLEMTDLKNFSQYEVSKHLNISYSGARSRVQRGRKMLRDRLNELFMIRADSYGNIIMCEDRVKCSCSCK